MAGEESPIGWLAVKKEIYFFICKMSKGGSYIQHSKLGIAEDAVRDPPVINRVRIFKLPL
jgi:hypothetical protein